MCYKAGYTQIRLWTQTAIRPGTHSPWEQALIPGSTLCFPFQRAPDSLLRFGFCKGSHWRLEGARVPTGFGPWLLSLQLLLLQYLHHICHNKQKFRVYEGGSLNLETLSFPGGRFSLEFGGLTFSSVMPPAFSDSCLFLLSVFLTHSGHTKLPDLYRVFYIFCLFKSPDFF